MQSTRAGTKSAFEPVHLPSGECKQRLTRHTLIYLLHPRSADFAGLRVEEDRVLSKDSNTQFIKALFAAESLTRPLTCLDAGTVESHAKIGKLNGPAVNI